MSAPARSRPGRKSKGDQTVHTAEDLGWNSFFASQLGPGDSEPFFPARVVEEQRGQYRLWSEAGEWIGGIAGKMLHAAVARDDLPVVGDWVMARSRPGGGRAIIHRILARKSKFSRRAAGKRTAEQILAANVDCVFIVTSLNRDFSLRRMERYLSLTWESGARPVILLSKSDLCADPAGFLAEAEAVAPGIPIHAVSAVTGEGLGVVSAYLGKGRTAVLLGSSGTGKSTLINRLTGGAALRVGPIRESDGRGRHTTTSRQLVLLSEGGMIIDTPGLRELQLWQSEESLDHTFEDVASLAPRCRYNDCRHQTEPGCAVLEALEEGALPPERLESYRKLQREMEHLAVRQDVLLRQEQKRKWKQVHKAFRNFNKRG